MVNYLRKLKHFYIIYLQKVFMFYVLRRFHFGSDLFVKGFPMTIILRSETTYYLQFITN